MISLKNRSLNIIGSVSFVSTIAKIDINLPYQDYSFYCLNK